MSALAADTPVIFLMGATACGKTALSVQFAHAINAEIISVDSALVYRGMDIGTAKPTLQEREGITHHLIDICDPWQAYSAAEFCRDASRLIQEIHARGRRALLVGGTMLYFKALEHGLAELPEADARLRAELVRRAQESGWQSLHDQLRSVDPEAAQRIHPNDPQRLQRALEVYLLTGTPLTEFQVNTRSELPCAPLKFALCPRNRSWLHQRIENRLQIMVRRGFLEEVQRLYDDQRLTAELPSMRSVGYRQAWEFLQLNRQHDARPDHENTTTWIPKAAAATRQLAKRQLTWLRSMSDLRQIECDTLPVEKQLRIMMQTLTQQENP